MSQRPLPDFTNVDGTISIEFISYQAGDHSADVYQDGRLVSSQPGYSLRELRQRLGGNEGVLLDPFKKQHHNVSIAHIAGDPDTTRVTIKYHFRPKR